MKRKIYLLALLFFPYLGFMAQNPGDLDPSFHGNGYLVDPTGGPLGHTAESVKEMPDGRLVVGGFERNNHNLAMSVYRYLPDGSPDPSFGTNGFVPGFGPACYWIREYFDMALQPDGKILLVSSTLGAETVLYRLDVDGNVDQTFAFGDGRIIESGADRLYGVKVFLQSSGRIVVLGKYITLGVEQGIAAFGYLPDGSPDPGFGTNGQAFIPMISGMFDDFDFIDAAQLGDGKMVIAGALQPSNQSIEPMLIRMNPDGSLDAGFGNVMLALTDYSGYAEQPSQIGLSATGGIFLSGFGSGPNVLRIRKYHDDGSTDISFGQSGALEVPVSVNSLNPGNLLVQPDGKVVFGGSTLTMAGQAFLLGRVLASGVLDPNFGNGGMVSTFASGTYKNEGHCLTQQQDGKIVCAGFSISVGTAEQYMLARYEAGTVTSAIGESGSGSLRVFPNPSSGGVQLELMLPEALEVSITVEDMQGRVVSVGLPPIAVAAGMLSSSLSLAELPDGVYVVTVRSADRMWCTRFVKRG